MTDGLKLSYEPFSTSERLPMCPDCDKPVADTTCNRCGGPWCEECRSFIQGGPAHMREVPCWQCRRHGDW